MRNIVAVDIGESFISDSQGRKQPIAGLSSVLDFLMVDNPDTFIVVWNLYQLLDVIQRYITEKDYNTLCETDKVWVGESGNRYKLFSVGGKQLSIKHEYKTHATGNFYDSVTKEVDVYNLCRFFPNYHPQCANDIKSKGDELMKALDSMGMGDTPTLASAIAIYDKTVMSDSYIPHLFDMSDTALDMCEFVEPLMTREWRTVYKIGHWPNSAWDIDLSGAYPSLVKDFGDLCDIKIWHGKKYQPCDWGVFKGKITIDADINPIVNLNKQPVKGTYTDYITTEQWAFLNHFKIGHFEPESGWMLKYNSQDKPFNQIMLDLYSMRGKGGLQADLAKGIAVGFIGRFAETYESKHGKHYNPFYSVLCTSRCSLKLGKMIYENNLMDNLISANVDGCLVDKEVNFGDRKELGAWRSERVNSIVISIGHSYTGTKHPDNHTYEDMKLAIEANPKANCFNDVLMVNNYGETNRLFTDYPATGGDLLTKIYRSRPIEVNGE